MVVETQDSPKLSLIELKLLLVVEVESVPETLNKSVQTQAFLTILVQLLLNQLMEVHQTEIITSELV